MPRDCGFTAYVGNEFAADLGFRKTNQAKRSRGLWGGLDDAGIRTKLGSFLCLV
jgi:hypothetical protein